MLSRSAPRRWVPRASTSGSRLRRASRLRRHQDRRASLHCVAASARGSWGSRTSSLPKIRTRWRRSPPPRLCSYRAGCEASTRRRSRSWPDRDPRGLGHQVQRRSPWVGAGLHIGNGVHAISSRRHSQDVWVLGLIRSRRRDPEIGGRHDAVYGCVPAALAAGKELLEALGIMVALICAHVPIRLPRRSYDATSSRWRGSRCSGAGVRRPVDRPRRPARARPRLEPCRNRTKRLLHVGGGETGRNSRASGGTSRPRGARAHGRLEELDLRLLADGRRRHQCGRRRRGRPRVRFRSAALQHGAQGLALGRGSKWHSPLSSTSNRPLCGSAGSGGGLRMPKARSWNLTPLRRKRGPSRSSTSGWSRATPAADDELRARRRRRRVERVVHDEGPVRRGEVEVPAGDGVAGHSCWVGLIARSF